MRSLMTQIERPLVREHHLSTAHNGTSCSVLRTDLGGTEIRVQFPPTTKLFRATSAGQRFVLAHWSNCHILKI